MLELYIGNKCFSSWSLRPWLALETSRHSVHRKICAPAPARYAGSGFLEVSPSGRVPVLHHDGRVVWDTLAILEYLAELFPDKNLWPDDTDGTRDGPQRLGGDAFRLCRSALQWGMNLRRPKAHKPLTEAGQKQAAASSKSGAIAGRRFGKGGPFLFGGFTAADAMYAPVVTRFDTYGGDLAPDTRAYVDAILTLPAMKEWYAGAAAEPWPEPRPDD